MKWTFSVKNKIRASLTLLLLCGIVFFSNYRLKQLSARVGESVKTIYEDRLIVQDLIFSYSKILYLLQGNGHECFNPDVLNTVSLELHDLEVKFRSTHLTEEEAKVFDSFSSRLQKVVTENGGVEESTLIQLQKELGRLEEIQMEEAGKQMKIINQAKKSQELSFYLETVILVILLVIVQILLVSNSALTDMFNEVHVHMN